MVMIEVLLSCFLLLIYLSPSDLISLGHHKVLLLGYSSNGVHIHIADKLIWHFFEHLLAQVAVSHGFVKNHELDDVTGARLTYLVCQTPTISIKLLHWAKVGVAHSYNDDRAGMVRQLEDHISCFTHVMDCSIRQQQKDWVRAISLHWNHVIHELSQQRSEQSWSTEAHLWQRILISGDNGLDSNDLRIGCIVVDSEAVADTTDAHLSGNSTEAEDWERPVWIVRLDNLANIQKSLFILVHARTKVMKRLRRARCAIACRVVDGCDHAHLPSWSEVINKSRFDNHFKGDNGKRGSSLAMQSCLSTLNLTYTRVKMIEHLIIHCVV